MVRDFKTIVSISGAYDWKVMEMRFLYNLHVRCKREIFIDMKKPVESSEKWISVIQLLTEFRLDIVSGTLVPGGVIVKKLIRDIILCSCRVDKYTILIFFYMYLCF